jgi:site-specific recombinase XerD
MSASAEPARSPREPLPVRATDAVHAPAARAELAELAAAMEDYAAAASSANTTRAYASDWRDFEAWCGRFGALALPADPGTAALYLTSLARRGLKVSTVRRRAAAITRGHRVAGHASPVGDPRVAQVLEGIARTHGAPPAKKVALLRDPLVRAVDSIDDSTVAGARDRAVLLVGFALGLRRTELVALAVEDVEPHPDGALVTIARSKTDQRASGARLLLAYADDGRPCPIRALRSWLATAGVAAGPVFRRVTRSGAVTTPLTAQSVALIVKRRVAAAGLDPAAFAGHSLRAGFATQAARDGYLPAQIADVTRHRDRRVLDGYIQAGRGAADVARVL